MLARALACCLILGLAASASADVHSGEVGLIEAGPGYFYLRLSGQPVLCASAGSGRGNKSAIVKRGSVVDGVTISDADVSRLHATANAAYLSGARVTVNVTNNTSYGCLLIALVLED